MPPFGPTHMGPATEIEVPEPRPDMGSVSLSWFRNPMRVQMPPDGPTHIVEAKDIEVAEPMSDIVKHFTPRKHM